MTLLSRIIFNLNKFIKFISVSYLEYLIFIVFLLVHILLVNVNTTEWGDSYRILRAAEYLKIGEYPYDEKRPPFFSIVLSLRPSVIEPVLWGRIVMFIVSVASFYVFYKILKLYFPGNGKDNLRRIISLILFSFNPIYLYWSIRIMADVPFSLLVMLVFYILKRNENNFRIFHQFILGFLTGIAILTRFEGYILFGSVLLGILFIEKVLVFSDLSPINFVKRLFSNLNKLYVYLVLVFLTILPYWLYQNPLLSSYLSEPEKRVYDLNMFWIYIVSLLYVFGFTSGFYFIFNNIKNVFMFLRQNVSIFSFVVVELLLILVWPAAVPRLFVPIIPFLIILLVMSLDFWEESSDKDKLEENIVKDRSLIDVEALDISYKSHKLTKLNKYGFYNFIIFVLLNTLLLGFYVISQYFLKLQFLILYKKVFYLVIILNTLFIIFYGLFKYRKLIEDWINRYLINFRLKFLSSILRSKYFKSKYLLSYSLICTFVSMILWTFATIHLHKNLLSTIKKGAEYANENLCGVIAYSDVSGLSNWYLNTYPSKCENSGFFYYIGGRKELKMKYVEDLEVDYFLITNEHNPLIKLDIHDLNHLEIIYDYRNNVNGTEFFVTIIKFNRP